MDSKYLERKPFTTINNEVFEDPNITGNDIAVFGALCSFANNKTRECWPSLKKIGEMVSYSRQTVAKSIKNLEEHGYIKVSKKYNGTKTLNHYTILDTVKDDRNEVNNINQSEHEEMSDVKNINPDDVKNINLNYTKDNNYTKKQDTLSKDKVCGEPTHQKQNTLFNVPKPLEKPKKKKRVTHREIGLGKIDDARKGLISWDDVTFRDFTYYFIERHNMVMDKKLEFNRYESVGVIRENLINSFNIPFNEVCDYIDKLLEIYSNSPNCWGYLSFNMIRSNYPMMKELMMKVQLQLDSEKEPKIDDITQKQLEEWKWNRQNIDKVPKEHVF